MGGRLGDVKTRATEAAEGGEGGCRVHKRLFRTELTESRDTPNTAISARRWAALRAAWIERRSDHKRGRSHRVCESERLSIHVPAEGRNPPPDKHSALSELCVRSSQRSRL